jgi:hypothetical protein
MEMITRRVDATFERDLCDYQAICLCVLAFSMFALLCFPSTAMCDDSSVGEIVYSRAVVKNVEGDVLSEDVYGEKYFIDDRGSLVFYDDIGEDAEGYSYIREYSAYSTSETESVYETKIVKIIPEVEKVEGVSAIKAFDTPPEELYPISKSLHMRLDELPPVAVEKFIVSLKSQPKLRLPRPERLLSLGLQDLYEDALVEKSEAIEQRKRSLFESQENLIQAAEAIGGKVTAQFWVINAFAVEMPVESVYKLAEHQDLWKIEMDGEPVFWSDETEEYPVYMTQVRTVTQT